MNAEVDYLPAWYSGNTKRRRATRERVLLAIPVVVALAVVDVVMRMRVATVRDMAKNAREHAEYGARVGEEAKTLAATASELQATLTEWSRPLATRRMTELLDELLAGRPPGITLHELVVHQTPWTSDSLPTFTVGAVSPSADDAKTWLELLRTSDVLPAPQYQRTDEGRDDAAFAFLLENRNARRGR